ncbi:hypothetical protein VWM74_10495 [Campylobacter jejuni]
MKLEDFSGVVDTNLSSAFLGCREAYMGLQDLEKHIYFKRLEMQV